MSTHVYEELVWQLTRLPGGTPAAIPDFFGHLFSAAPEKSDRAEIWHFHDNTHLELHDTQLSAQCEGEVTAIAQLPDALLAVAEKSAISPLLLGLLALATGDVEGDRRLKRILPKADGAAKDLMLMTVCRLCG